MKKIVLIAFIMVGWFALFGDEGHADELSYEQVKRVAEKGHAVAQYKMASMLFNGNGVPKNNGEALNWYIKAAE